MDIPHADGGIVADAGHADDPCLVDEVSSTFAELGTGAFSPEPLVDGQALAFEAGPQGGHHVWVSVRSRGVMQSGTLTTFGAVDVDTGMRLAQRTVPFVLRPDADGACTLSGMRLQLDEDPAVDLHARVGHRVRLHVRMEDAEGRALEDACTVVLAAPAAVP